MDEEAFLRAITEAPADDAPRLVYADWLEERGGVGDGPYAEFIRLTVGRPDQTYWLPGEGPGLIDDGGRAARLCRDHRESWTDRLRARVAGSPLGRWLGTDACRWAYRRGLVAVFEGTQQAVLDAWDDLFRLGPVEEVGVRNLWHLGSVSSLRAFLDRPVVRALRLESANLREDCVDWLVRVADWLRRLDRVDLSAGAPDPAAAGRLAAWLAADPSLRHIRWHGP